MKKTTIYLVRHGESESNKQGIVAGHTDPELTEEGKDQVRQTKLTLQKVHFDEVYSSDLKRAVHTAEILYGKPVDSNNRMHVLRERYFGSLEGKPESVFDKINVERTGLSDEEDWVYKHVPDMENDYELTLRFIPALEQIAQSNQGKTILIVGHGGTIRTAIMKLAGYTNKELPHGSFANAGYAELAYDPRGLKVIQISGVKL